MAVQKKPAADQAVRARAEGRTYTSEQLLERAGQLEGKLAQVRNRYEQYFLGLERKPPSTDRDAIHKELDQLRQISTPNTALKFRLNTLFNRLLTYERMWDRTAKDIEEGRYKRDLFKAKLHAKERRPTGPSEDVDTNFDEDTDTQLEAPVVKAKPPPPKAPTGGPDDTRLRAVYDAFVKAKRECREPIDGLTYESVAARLKDQIPQLSKQTGGKPIDFKVVIKDGKAQLRAVVKE